MVKYLYRQLQGEIRQVSITHKNNKFYLNITTDYINSKKETKKEVVGIDIGLKYLVVASDGTKIKNTTHSKYFDKQIAQLQHRQSKLKKGSNQYKFLNKVMLLRKICIIGNKGI